LKKTIFNILYLITLVLLFLPAFAFQLGSRTYRIFFIALLTFFGLYLIASNVKFLNVIKLLLKQPQCKYLAYFIIYLFVSTLIIYTYNPNFGIASLKYISQFALLYIIPCYLLSAYFTPKFLTFDKFMKFYLSALFLIFVFGLIEYFGGRVMGISFINNLQQFLANERLIMKDVILYYQRLTSVFAEPSWLGNFIFLNFPIIYKCCGSKFRIFDNPLINIVIKRTLMPLAWLNIIFTKSPIWLLFCIIQAIIIFRKEILKINAKKIIIVTIISVLFCIITLYYIDTLMHLPQIERLTKVINNFSKFEDLLEVEVSLGTRIVSFYTQLLVFIEHPILGIGLNNIADVAGDFITKYSIPMTTENYKNYLIYLQTGKMHLNVSTFYTLIAQTGVIGTLIYYAFIAKSTKVVKSTIKNLGNSLAKDFSSGLYTSLCFYIVMTLYETVLAMPFNWFFFGLATAVTLYFNKHKEKQLY